MTVRKMKALLRLATEQGVELKTVKEFAEFARRVEL